MFKNVAGQKIALFAFDSTTGKGIAGDAANITPYVNKDYAGANALADTSATEISATNQKGWYLFDTAQAETNGDALLFSGKSATANIEVVGQLVFTLPAGFTSSVAQTGDGYAVVNSGTFGNAALKVLIDAVDDFLDTEILDIRNRLPAALVSGRMDASVGAMAANVLAAAATNADFLAEIRAEIVAALVTDTYAEPSSVPAATSSLKDKISYLFTAKRNKTTQTATTTLLRNDADSATIATTTVADNGTTFTKGEDA